MLREVCTYSATHNFHFNVIASCPLAIRGIGTERWKEGGEERGRGGGGEEGGRERGGEEGGRGRGGVSLDKVMDDDGVRRGQQSLQAARDLSKFHPWNLKNLQDNRYSPSLTPNNAS